MASWKSKLDQKLNKLRAKLSLVKSKSEHVKGLELKDYYFQYTYTNSTLYFNSDPQEDPTTNELADLLKTMSLYSPHLKKSADLGSNYGSIKSSCDESIKTDFDGKYRSCDLSRSRIRSERIKRRLRKDKTFDHMLKDGFLMVDPSNGSPIYEPTLFLSLTPTLADP